jgi:CheY-like chemotaxis protein
VKNELGQFARAAERLSKTPLGIISLFLVLVYGLSVLVTFSGTFTHNERLFLIIFLVSFPVAVLLVFSRLISRNHIATVMPADFKNEENYVRLQMEYMQMRMASVASLTAAASKTQQTLSEDTIQRIIDAVELAAGVSRSPWPNGLRDLKDKAEPHNHVLWVDDNPENNVHERRALEEIGIRFTLATSTEEGLELCRRERHPFAAIISDMRRKEGPLEGFNLLDKINEWKCPSPLFFYTSNSNKADKEDAIARGAQGLTSDPTELFDFIMGALTKDYSRRRNFYQQMRKRL